MGPVQDEHEGNTVTIQIGPLKAHPVPPEGGAVAQQGTCPTASKEVVGRDVLSGTPDIWVLIRHSDRDGTVELKRPMLVNDIYIERTSFCLLDFGSSPKHMEEKFEEKSS